MFVYLLLCMTVLVCTCVYTRWMHMRRYWEHRGVPCLPLNIVLGNLTFLMRVNPAIWFREIYSKLKTRYIGVWLLWQPALVVNDPQLARRILVTDSDYFRNRHLGSDGTLDAHSLLLANDPEWNVIRKRISILFTSAKMRMYECFVREKTNQLVQRIKFESKKGKPIDIKEIYTDFTTDVTGLIALGISEDATLTGDSTLRRLVYQLSEHTLSRAFSWAAIFFLPHIASLFGCSMYSRSSEATLRAIFRAVVAQKSQDVQFNQNKDLIDILMKMKKETSDLDVTCEDRLVAQAGILLIGGYETTSLIMTYMTYELAFNPLVQEKMYRELLNAKREKQHESLDLQTLAELQYLNCVIKEILRLYPTMGWIDRVASSEYRMDEQCLISAGTPVYVNSIGIHYDPSYYREPTRFNPERFLPENARNLKPFTYLPFGEGPRHCIGMRFAQMNLRLAISSLLLNYELRPLPQSRPLSEHQFEKKSMLLVPATKLSIQYIHR